MRNFTSAVFWAALALLLYGGPAFSTHFSSLEVWHEDIGNAKYRVYSAQYLDCSGAAAQSYFPIGSTTFTPPPPFYSHNSLAGCTVVVDTAWQISSFMEVTPLCPTLISSCQNPGSPIPGIGYIKHVQVIQVSNCNPAVVNPVLNLTFDNCCRTGSITSLINPSSTGIYVEHPIFLNVSNSNPDLVPLPLSLCDGQSSTFFVGGVDPEGDSLLYLLAPAMDDPMVPVQYAPGFSFINPMGPGWTVNLDSQTGILSVTPNPGGVVTAVIKLVIEEYRNGVLVGKTERDLGITVQQCSANTQPVGNGIGNLNGAVQASPNVIDFCLGSTVDFSISFFDPDPSQALSVTHSIFQALPGASVSINGTNPLVVGVSWTPTPADTTLKSFYVSVSDDVCPIPGIYTEVYYLSPSGTCIIPTIVETDCQDSTGSISVSILGAPGPFSYLWNTGGTDSVITGLPVGTYWMSAYDSTLNITFSDTFLLTAQDVILTTLVTQPDCNLPTGDIQVQASGGFPPYSYQWNTGATGASINNLAPGGYNVIVTDSVGCFQQSTVILDPPDSCFVTISGRVYHDANVNCVADMGEFGLQGILINYSPGGMVLTDSNGVYEFKADTGLVDIEVYTSYLNNIVCPPSYTVYNASYGIDTSGFDFGVDTVLFHDLSVSLSSSPPVWNGTVKYYVSAQNQGTLVANNAVKTLNYPADLTPISFFPTPQSIDTVNHIITWSTGLLVPSDWKTCFAYFAVGSSYNIGDTLIASASIELIPGDVDSTNNHTTDTAIVVAAYDPNDKQATPSGIGEPGYILPTTPTLDYRIRFQNTGNFPATYVVIRDTLSPHLDLSQYRTIGASHNFQLTVEEDSIMVFTFANINLPAEVNDPAGSQGFVEFQIGLDANLPVGTMVENDVAIYFDFNPPIYTNTALNTIYTQPMVVLQTLPFYCVEDEVVADIVATGMAPYTYEWSVGNSVVTSNLSDAIFVAQSGWVEVKIIDDFGFTSTDSVFVNAIPPVSANFSWNFTGNGFEIEFTDYSSGANDYFWYFENGLTSTQQNPVVTFANAGLWEVTLVARNECGADTITTMIELRNDAIDSWPYQQVSLQPNPASVRTTIVLPESRSWNLRLTDVEGRIVKTWHEDGDFSVLETQEFADGVYFLSISDERYQTVIPFVVRK